MKALGVSFRSASLAGLLLVLPFLILEWANRRSFQEAFPAFLFGILWLLITLLVMTFVPILRALQAGNGISARPIPLALRVTAVVVLAWLWASVLIDQMPCFLSALDCD